MFKYLENAGVSLEKAQPMPEYAPGILEEAKKLMATLESMSDATLDRILGEMQKDYTRWLDSDKDNYYSGLESVNLTFGMESAYNRDRNIIKSALMRLRMAFAIWADNKVTADYISILRELNPEKVSQSTSSVVLNKENVAAYVEVMSFINSTVTIDSKELEKIVRELTHKIDSKVAKIVAGGMLSVAAGTTAAPVLILFALAFLMYHVSTVPKIAEDIKAQYGDQLKQHMVTVIKNSGVGKIAGVTVDKTGLYDVSSLTKIANVITGMKTRMMPVKIRQQLGRPNFLKSKVDLTYNEKIAIVNMVKDKSDMIVRTIGDTPARLNNTIRFALASDQITQDMQEGYMYGVPTEDTMYSALCENIIALTVDAITVSCLLVVDFKKY